MTAKDTLHVMHPRAAGIDARRMQVTATARIARENADAEIRTREFSALPGGPASLAGRLRGHGVTAAAMEGAGVYRETACDAVAGTGATPLLLHARHVRQINNSLSFCPHRAVCRGSLSLARLSRTSGSGRRMPAARFRRGGSCRRSARNGFADSGLDAGSGHVLRHGAG